MNLEIFNMEVVRALYIVSAVLFILTLGGLSNQETSRRGNQYGIAAMIIAITATILGPQVTANYSILVILMLLGGSFGLILSKKVKMTEMPELVAILHSLVGLAAVLVGIVNFINPSMIYIGAEQTIHLTEIYKNQYLHKRRSTNRLALSSLVDRTGFAIGQGISKSGSLHKILSSSLGS